MAALLEVVRLTRDVPEASLRRGDVGTVVEVFRRPEEAYEVEFIDAQGRTTALVTLLPADVEVVQPGATRSGAPKPGEPATSLV